MKSGEDVVTKHDTNSDTLTPFQLTVLLLSIIVLFMLGLDLLFSLPRHTLELLAYVDLFICIVFFIDFVQQFRQAPSKLQYMKYGWIDLVSCIPLMEVNQYGRLVRLFRLIRAIKSISLIAKTIRENKVRVSMHFMVVLSLMMLLFGSIYVLYAEQSIPGSNIQTATDAFWWAFITITTVGYGDFYPVSGEGRIIAVILITTGVGMFGSVTAVLAAWVMDPGGERKREEAIYQEVLQLRREMQDLRLALEKQQRTEGIKPAEVEQEP